MERIIFKFCHKVLLAFNDRKYLWILTTMIPILVTTRFVFYTKMWHFFFFSNMEEDFIQKRMYRSVLFNYYQNHRSNKNIRNNNFGSMYYISRPVRKFWSYGKKLKTFGHIHILIILCIKFYIRLYWNKK